MTIALVSRELRAYFNLFSIRQLYSRLQHVSLKNDCFLPISNEDDKWHAIAELVRTRGWTGGVCSREFVKQPVRGRAKALLMLFPIYRQLNVHSPEN